MLGAILLAASVPQATPLPPQLPDMNHMVRDGLIGPRRSTVSVEWFCPTSPLPSRATITITDSGQPSWNKNFSVKLNRLSVEGRKPSAAVMREVQSGLARLKILGTFLGECSGRAPGLFIKGFSYDGDRVVPETMHLYLK